MTKRSREGIAASSRSASSVHQASHDVDSDGGDDATGLKKPRSFMATLACDVCRSRKTRCDEDQPKCGYCKTMNLECTYQAPRTTKKDQSMAVAINAIRRLESKVEDLTNAVKASTKAMLPQVPDNRLTCHAYEARPQSLHSSSSQPSPASYVQNWSPKAIPALESSTLSSPKHVSLSFSQHRVALWPAIQETLSAGFFNARANLPQDYIVEIESQRAPLPIQIDRPYGTLKDTWLMSLLHAVAKGLADAYFAVFGRTTPILDKFFFYSNTLGMALDSEYDYNIESCLVLVVLALGCLAVKAHEEGNFALPSRRTPSSTEQVFKQPDWYELIVDHPPGLKFFNEARKRFGFLMCQNDLQAGQYYMLSTLYYAQVLRPLDSWATVNRAALCCTTLLSRKIIDYDDEWAGDMFCRLFWNTLMYETVITQELDLLPHSGLQEYEAEVPLPKFIPCPRYAGTCETAGSHPRAQNSHVPSSPYTTMASTPDHDDSIFNFHFLAQAAHRIILTRIKQNLYVFAERENYPSAGITAEMHHQLEQWRNNLPLSLQFSEDDETSGPGTRPSPSPAHVIAKAMLRSRYLVAKFHIGRPFLYKALHAPAYTTDAEYNQVREGLRGGMYWPTTMGLCAQMLSALPIKFGWCCQCFGQVLLFNAVAQSSDPKLRDTLPEGWRDWIAIMMDLIESCARDSPGIAKDVELLRLL